LYHTTGSRYLDNLNNMTVATEKITYQAFREMNFPEDDTAIYELLNGVLVKKSAPSLQHQRAVRNLFRALDKFVESSKFGEVLFAPMGVKFDDYNVLQPDLFFVSNTRKNILKEEGGYVDGAPDMIIEVLSPGSIKRDRMEKKSLYAEHGVPEYWIVDPLNRSVEVYKLVENQYVLDQFVEFEEEISSSVLPGFKIKLIEIMNA